MGIELSHGKSNNLNIDMFSLIIFFLMKVFTNLTKSTLNFLPRVKPYGDQHCDQQRGDNGLLLSGNMLLAESMLTH